MTSVEQRLPARPTSVPAARRFVEQTLEQWELGEAAWAAVQLVSELATNAVLHAATPFSVELSRAGTQLRVAVRDDSPASPAVRQYGPQATTGRGLRLVDSMAADWGVDADGDGKAVWFVLELDARSTARAWDDGDEVDLDALLAGFDDGEQDGVVTALLRPTHDAQALAA